MFRQRGSSLISLMVGLLITSITMMAMLSLYQDSLRMVMSSTVSAFDSSDRLSSAMITDRILQRAGFGIEAPDPVRDLVVLQGATFRSGRLYASSENAPQPQKSTGPHQPPSLDGREGTHIHTGIIWGLVENGNPRCEGLISIATETGHGLMRITSDDDCQRANANWNGVDWIASVISWHRYLSDDGLSPSDDQWLRIRVNRSANCWPFGIQTEDEPLTSPVSVSIVYPVFNVKGIPRKEVESSTCLVNFS